MDVAAIKNSPPPLTLSEQERRKKFRPQLEVLWEQSVLRGSARAQSPPESID